MSAAEKPLPPTVRLELTAQEVTAVIAFLMKFPAEQVYMLLKKIELQCNEQANAEAKDG